MKNSKLSLHATRDLKRQDVVPLSWNIAKGVYIPKEENSCTVHTESVPANIMLNIEGKIMFGIHAERLSSFVLVNGLINTLCPKCWDI